jgi:hypothetical protein
MLKSSNWRVADWLRLLTIWIGLAQCCGAGDLRVRIQWGGEVAKAWHGVVRVTHGELSDLALLGRLPDEANAMHLTGNELRIHSPGERLSDGADLTVSGGPDATLTINLASEAGHPATEVSIPLRELAQHGRTEKLDDDHSRVTINRTPGDRLRFQCTRTSLVFTPGEEFAFRVTPYALGIAPGNALKLQCNLLEVGETKPAWTAEKECSFGADGDLVPLDWELMLPNSEGVYELHLTLTNPRFTDRLGVHKTIAERSVQLVVLGSKPVATSLEPLAKVFELDPANTKWWERFPPTLLASAGLRRGPVGSGDAARWQHPQLGAMTQLGSLTHGHVSWEALPLVVTEPQQPHVLEVEYPCDVPQSLGISILESSGGQNYSLLDSGIVVTDAEADRPAAISKQRIIFWPKTKTPLLVLTNPRPTGRAVFGKIRVLGPKGSALAMPLTKANTTPILLPRAPGVTDESPRLALAYCDQPFLSEELTNDLAAAEDWSTFYHGARHMANYLEHVGYGGVMLNVAAEGSTLYPSRLRPSQRLDAGRLRASGEDPVRKDVLEVVLRALDRANLRCVPMLDLSGMIPELEDYLALHDDVADLGARWIGPEGVVASEKSSASSVRYNPLSPRVQSAVLAVVREIVERYGDHERLSGVALQLSTTSPLVLSASEGPFDDETFVRFARRMQFPNPEGEGRFAQRAQLVSGAARDAWLQWRAEELHQFHIRLRDEVAKLGPTATLYLVGTHLFDDPQLRSLLRPNLPNQSRPEDTLTSLGIITSPYRSEPQLVLMRPYQSSPSEPLAARGTGLELNRNADLDRLLLMGQRSGAVISHTAEALQLQGAEAISPGLPSALTLRPSFTNTESHVRQWLSRSLATQDCVVLAVGGPGLCRGQEEAMQDWLTIFQQLPVGRYETVTPETQPVIVRTLVRGGETFLYALNDSAWPANVNIPLEMSSDVGSEPLVTLPRKASTLKPGADGWQWNVPLGAYDLAAIKIKSPSIRVGKPKVNLDENVALQLQRKVQDLGARAAALAAPPPYLALANAGFEQPAKVGNIPGWIAKGTPSEAISLDAKGHTGNSALQLRSDGKEVTVVQSVPFAVPATGRLAVSAWLRASSGEDHATFRMGIVGGRGTENFARFAAVGPGERSGGRLSERWAPFQFEVNDLPSDPDAELRVQFELLGTGEVLVDDVQTSALSFTETEQVELTKLVALANFKLQSGQIRDCAGIIEGYWPQFLLEHVPLIHSPVATAQRQSSATEKARDITPGNSPRRGGNVLERVKDIVPRLKRP